MQDNGTEQKKSSQKAGPQPTKYLRDPVLMKLPHLFKQQKTQGVQLILSLKGVSVYNSPPEKQSQFSAHLPHHAVKKELTHWCQLVRKE